jgi:hypothetical protein
VFFNEIFIIVKLFLVAFNIWLKEKSNVTIDNTETVAHLAGPRASNS